MKFVGAALFFELNSSYDTVTLACSFLLFLVFERVRAIFVFERL